MSDHTRPPDGIRTLGDDPTGTRLLLIRHGEAVVNAEGLVGGAVGCRGLTERGRAQAEALLQRLTASRELAQADVGYVSGLRRAQETGAIIAPAVPALTSPTIEPLLNELEPGEADGLTWTAYADTYAVPNWDVEPTAPFSPGGESLVSFATRCADIFGALAARHPGQLVVAVCHGGVIEQLLRLTLGYGPTTRLRLRTEHCSLTEVEWTGARPRLLRYNDRQPLH